MVKRISFCSLFAAQINTAAQNDLKEHQSVFYVCFLTPKTNGKTLHKCSLFAKRK